VWVDAEVRKVLDANTYEVLAIDVPARRDQDGTLLAPSTAPPALDAAATELRHPPRERAEFLPELMKEHHGFKERTDLKPLIISQPEGVSFSMNGNELEWQKWKMHVGFHYREVSPPHSGQTATDLLQGLVISTVTYNDDGRVRPLFYRLSLAEMGESAERLSSTR
jgi:primary-amine oxidase